MRKMSWLSKKDYSKLENSVFFIIWYVELYAIYDHAEIIYSLNQNVFQLREL